MGLPQLAPTTPKRVTVDEYLRFEREAQDRHEYFDGTIVAMAGESNNHGIISVNVVVSLGSQLKGKRCQVRTKDTKVRSGRILKAGRSAKGQFSYPDVVVICGEPEFHDAMADVIVNPKVILEVVSPSTEARDRGRKFHNYYEWSPTLTDYVLVSQDYPIIDHFFREEGGSWGYQRYVGMDAVAPIESIGCVLRLTDVFERVEFPPEEESDEVATGTDESDARNDG